MFMTEEEADLILDEHMELIRSKIRGENCAQESQASAGGPLAEPDCIDGVCCGCCAAFQGG